MTRSRPWLVPLLIAALIAGVVLLDHVRRPEATARQLDCPDLSTGCAVALEGRAVTVGVTGALKVLTPFEVWVRTDRADKIQISFTMEGMDMGFNLYTLRADNEGVYRTRVTLPVCVTGRRDWVMTLEIDGLRLAVPFVTEL